MKYTVARGLQMLIIFAMYIKDASSACDLQRVSACVSRADLTDIKNICQSLTQIKQCLTPFKTECQGSRTYMTLTAPLDGAETLCGSNGCSLLKIRNCTEAWKNDVDLKSLTANSLVQMCPRAQGFVSCIEPLKEPCSKVDDPNVQAALQTVEGSQSLLTTFCDSTTVAGFKKYQQCFQTSSVQTSGDKCMGELDQTDNAGICNRMTRFEPCMKNALKTKCTDDAAIFIINVIKKFSRLMIQITGEEIPSCLNIESNNPPGNGAVYGHATLVLVILGVSLTLLPKL